MRSSVRTTAGQPRQRLGVSDNWGTGAARLWSSENWLGLDATLCSESTSSRAKGKAVPRAANKVAGAPTKRRRAAKTAPKIATQKSACHEDDPEILSAQPTAPASPIFDDDNDELQVKRLCSSFRATGQHGEHSERDTSAAASLASLSPQSAPLPQQRQLPLHQALPLPPPLPAPPRPSLLNALPYFPNTPIEPAPLYPGIAGPQSALDSCYRFGQPPHAVPTQHWQTCSAMLQPPSALSGVAAAYGPDIHAQYRALQQQQQQLEHARQQAMYAQLLFMQQSQQSRLAAFLQGSSFME